MMEQRPATRAGEARPVHTAEGDRLITVADVPVKEDVAPPDEETP